MFPVPINPIFAKRNPSSRQRVIYLAYDGGEANTTEDKHSVFGGGGVWQIDGKEGEDRCFKRGRTGR